MFQLLLQVCRGCLYGLRSLFQLLLKIVVVIEYALSGQRFNSAHTCSNTALGKDLECLNFSGVGNMGTATELLGVIVHAYNTNRITVFFAK